MQDGAQAGERHAEAAGNLFGTARLVECAHQLHREVGDAAMANEEHNVQHLRQEAAG